MMTPEAALKEMNLQKPFPILVKLHNYIHVKACQGKIIEHGTIFEQ